MSSSTSTTTTSQSIINAPTLNNNKNNKTLHIAPMMDVTHREFRYFMRLLTKHAVLWTEMVVDETVVHSSDRYHHLGFDPEEHPIVCQIGGNNKQAAYEATKIIAQDFHYDAIDLNCACPSKRVCGKNAFGAALMLNQQLAVDMIESMQRAASDTTIPVSIKTRIGVDDQDDLDFLVEYIRKLQPHVKRFFIHARKVHTKGLSPVQNRTIPPLNYPRVYALCRHFPDCDFYINGGIKTIRDAYNLCYGSNDMVESDLVVPHNTVPCYICKHANGSCVVPPSRDTVPPNLCGVMLGRAARENPSIFADADRYFYKCETNPCHNRRQVLTLYCEYLERVYPRRCCDEDPRITSRMPAPQVERLQDYCNYCRQVYQQDGCNFQGPSYWNKEGVLENEKDETAECTSGRDENCNPVVDNDNNNNNTINDSIISNRIIKIPGHIVDRSFKPVLGLFFGKKGCSKFRRKIESLSKDARIRNCGPGALLRMAMNSMDDASLDEAFALTEDATYEHQINCKRSQDDTTNCA